MISRLVAGFANSAGLFLIIIIQYAVFAATGTCIGPLIG